MSKLTILGIILFLVSMPCRSQRGEFKMYSNGFMYSDETINQLKFIVDSLNIKFQACELEREYLSKNQAKANFVIFKNKNIQNLKEDLLNNISFDDFVIKYPEAKVEEDLLVVKYSSIEEGDIQITINSQIEESRIRFTDTSNWNNSSVKGSWIFTFFEETSYSDAEIWAFYFASEFESKPLTEKYARLIQYADCMIDTSHLVYSENARFENFQMKVPSKTRKFLRYVNRKTKKPKFKKKNEDYFEDFVRWDTTKFASIDSILVKKKKFHSLLRNAVSESKKVGYSNRNFEQYVNRYYSKELALDLKRSRIVYGRCSMDNSPRRHALEIALLSAETVNWDIFLRAHLDIMNDNFHRASDGSYAWGGRKTYLKELEELEIEIHDLLLGICLRIENPSANHYYGSIHRIGRALSETKDTDGIEVKMLDMIKDNNLDHFNRILIYYLFKNYNYHLDNEKTKLENDMKLQEAKNQLPPYLAKRLISQD